ncbi:hypothetical protein CR513_39863, partial [Mucuna pruriens]
MGGPREVASQWKQAETEERECAPKLGSARGSHAFATYHALVQCGILQNQSSYMNMIEVRVPNLDCEGCASKLKKALFKLKDHVKV